MTQTYTPTLDAMGKPQMGPVPAGDWVRAEDHAAALAIARDDALREVAEKLSVQVFHATSRAEKMTLGPDIRFWDTVAENFKWCQTMVQAMIDQPAPPREQCCVCGADVDTCEVSEGGGPDGAQLSGGKWVCSSECFDAAPADKTVHFYGCRKTPETLTAAKVTDIPAQPREATVQEAARVLRGADDGVSGPSGSCFGHAWPAGMATTLHAIALKGGE